MVALSVIMCGCQLAYAQSKNTEEKGEDSVEKITVVGTVQSRYVIGNSSSLTGFELDFLELPRIVNVIPEQLILDQKVTELTDALRNTPGISLSDGFGGTNDDFLIRGFRRNEVYRNGFRRQTNFKTNLSNVEYTQIIRGPASITYGQVEPGGLVDIVTKKPLAQQRFAGEARFGSFNDKFALIDLSQPLGEEAGIRIVGSVQDAESFRDFTDIKRDTLSISGTFAPSSTTRLNLSYEYRDEARPLDRGTITVPTPEGRAIINDLRDIPNSRRFGEEFEIFDTSFNFFDATLEHDLSQNWNLRLGAAYEVSSSDDLQARPLAVAIFDANGPVTDDGFIQFQTPDQIPAIIGGALQSLFDDPTDRVFLARRTDGNLNADVDVFYLNAVIAGEIATGNILHRIAIGANYRDFEREDNFVFSPNTNGLPTAFGGSGPLFNIDNPVFGNLPTELDASLFPRRLQTTEEYGIFINDYIEVTDRFSVLVGGRFDSVKLTPLSSIESATELSSTEEFSPQVALNYEINGNTSVFASYSESFQPNEQPNLTVSSSEAFDPEDSEQIEFGLKAEFFGGNLQTSASFYDIEKTNVLTVENDVPILREGQTSKGTEVSVSGQPIQGMNIIAGYAYTDSEVGGLGSTSGNQPRNVAENTFNLWASYEFQTGKLEGLGLGGGYFFVDDRPGDDANSFILDSYNLVDLSIWYTLAVSGVGSDDTVRFQLAVKNLFDEEYFSASGGDLRISIGAPRTVFGSVSFAF
jgi:iron complex outermembrane receptor protein